MPLSSGSCGCGRKKNNVKDEVGTYGAAMTEGSECSYTVCRVTLSASAIFQGHLRCVFTSHVTITSLASESCMEFELL